MSGDQQVRLMASQFAEKSLLYPKIEKLDDNVLASQYICITVTANKLMLPLCVLP